MFKRDEFLHGKLLTDEKVAHQFVQNFRYQQQCKKRFCGSFHLGHQTHTHTQWLNKSKHNIKGKYRCQWFHDTIPFKFTTNKSNYRYRIMQIKNEKQMHGMAWNKMKCVKWKEMKRKTETKMESKQWVVFIQLLDLKNELYAKRGEQRKTISAKIDLHVIGCQWVFIENRRLAITLCTYLLFMLPLSSLQDPLNRFACDKSVV